MGPYGPEVVLSGPPVILVSPGEILLGSVKDRFRLAQRPAHVKAIFSSRSKKEL